MTPYNSFSDALPAWLIERTARLRSGKPDPMDVLWLDPGRIFRARYGGPPDPWQEEFLRGSWSQALLCCARQTGKSASLAALIVRTILAEAPSRALIVSPSERQSKLIYNDHLLPFLDALGWPVKPDGDPGKLELRLTNGSDVFVLPDNARTTRGYSGTKLVVIDEASQVGDELYYSIRPTLSVSGGRLAAGSTPWGQRGWFFEEFEGEGLRKQESWKRFRVTARECPRHCPEFLASELEEMGERWYNTEYGAVFEQAVGSVFDHEAINRAFRGGRGVVKPLWEA